MHFATKAIHQGQEPDKETGAIITPIYQASTYVQPAPGQPKGFSYSRTDNPTRQALEKNLAPLENARYALVFSSGLAAVNNILNTFKSGDHVVSASDIYGGTYRLFTRVFQNYNIEFTFVDPTDLNNISGAIKANTKLLWLETPSNPLLKVTDIKAAVAIGKKSQLTVVVDNTFATPYLQLPLDLGADVVLQSTTKYLGGHSDIVGGAVITNDEKLHEQYKFYQNAVGTGASPLDCFLVLRGIKTLALRMERHCENARAVAEFLEQHSKVEKVYYPGLPGHPGHEIAKKQMRDFGAMLSFEPKCTDDQAKKLVASTKIFSLAESLGCVRSLINHPPTMTHASVPADVRKKIGISEKLIRLSVGIEDKRDLIADLEQMLDQI
ncbi:MAG: cystathionine gamma-synthase [Planctomycetes bacterium]|nr:cystathionine gamma-synthase [Planctomycetota bacterium]